MNNPVMNNNDVTLFRLEQIVRISKKTMSLLLEQADEGVLKSINDKQAFEAYAKQLDNIIITALREEFKI